MKKLILILVTLFFFNNLYSSERSDKEIRNGVFLEDLEELGEFSEIKGDFGKMFKEQDYKYFSRQAAYSQKKISQIFVKGKSMIDKYPERLMLGMGYFEFFYMNELKKNQKYIESFKKNYPNINGPTRKKIKQLYGLNIARKKMREALGFNLQTNTTDVIKSQAVLAELFSLGIKKENIIEYEQKNKNKKHKKITKELMFIKNLIEKKNEKRISDKNYHKEYNKNFKKLNSLSQKLPSSNSYQVINEMINLMSEIENNDIDKLISLVNIIEYILKEISKKEITKKHFVDLTDVDFKKFNQNQIEMLGKISEASKLNQKNKSNLLQKDIFNLENKNININKYLNEIRNNGIELTSINLQLESASKMNLWATKDWANAWKSNIPTRIEGEEGILIDLSNEDIESIKAQLSMHQFNKLIEIDEDLFQVNETMEQIVNNLQNNNFQFSYGLDDYARFLGDIFHMDINNYSDLTDLANATHNANWSVEEYASAYQVNVDFINALASGTSSFDAAQVAQNLGASLAEVAETIQAASSAGISVDLEAAAQGLGYGSFADAVAAYNAQHGTNYTVDEAKAALGQ